MDTKYCMILKERKVKKKQETLEEVTKVQSYEDIEYELESIDITQELYGSRTALKLEQSLDRINRGEVKAFALVVLTENEGLESITIKYDSPLSKMALEIALDMARERVKRDVEVRVEEMSEVIE